MAAKTRIISKSLFILMFNSILVYRYAASYSEKVTKYNPLSKRLNETILESVPWSVKILLLRNINPKDISGDQNSIDSFSRRTFGQNPMKLKASGSDARKQESFIGEVHQDGDPEKGDREKEGEDAASHHDEDMRLKLFRLMYETVRDSDLKVKRAELIRSHYLNSTTWEVGFLMAEIVTRHDIIKDFATTLVKFFKVWRPVEHVNVYEQVANHAININRLIDYIKTIGRGAM